MDIAGLAPNTKLDIKRLSQKLEGLDPRKREDQLLISLINSKIKSLQNPSTESAEKRKRLGTWGLGEMPIPQSALSLINDRIKKGREGKKRWKNLANADPSEFILTLTRKNKKRKPAPFTMTYLTDNGMKMDEYYGLSPKERMKFLWSSFYQTPKGKRYILAKEAKLQRMIKGLEARSGLKIENLSTMKDEDLNRFISEYQ